MVVEGGECLPAPNARRQREAATSARVSGPDRIVGRGPICRPMKKVQAVYSIFSGCGRRRSSRAAARRGWRDRRECGIIRSPRRRWRRRERGSAP